MRKVLITGISGYLGSHVAKLCLNQGYYIRGAVQNLNDKDKLVHLEQLQQATGKKIEFVEAALEKYESWDYAIKGCDNILHLAAPLPGRDTKNEQIESHMLQGIQAIFEYGRKHGVKTIVVTGTALNTGIYSNYSKKVFTEDDWAEVTSEMGYLRGKTKLEKFAWNYHKDNTFNLSFIHPAVMYGPLIANYANGSVRQIASMFLNRMAYLHLCLPIVDVRDVALAHVKAMESSESNGKRYLCSGGSLWLDEMPNLLEAEFGKYGYKCKRLPGGEWFMKLAALLNSETKRIVESRGMEFVVSSERARKDLGASFRDPRKTIIDTVYSLIEKGIIPDKINNKAKAI